jgi:hypothetical protein
MGKLNLLKITVKFFSTFHKHDRYGMDRQTDRVEQSRDLSTQATQVKLVINILPAQDWRDLSKTSSFVFMYENEVALLIVVL